MYLEITKPVEDDYELLEQFELTSPNPRWLREPLRSAAYRKKGTIRRSDDIPITEWQRRLAMVPEAAVIKTLDNTTQNYSNLEAENRQDPRRHFRWCAPGLRVPRLNEEVASDTFFPSVKSKRGNTCSQFFAGQSSRRWDVFPLKSEKYNDTALQDFTRQVGAPDVLISDNAQSETGADWTKHCRTYCINTKTTEPHTPWQNPAEPDIGKLGSRVKNCMRAFNVPLQYHDWVQKWVCECHNHTANRTLNWSVPESKRLGYTPDISRFRFHVWEPIWYFEPGTNQPEHGFRKSRWLGFAKNCGDHFTYFI